MSFSQLLGEIRAATRPALVARFNVIMQSLSTGGSWEYYAFFDRLNEPIKARDSHEVTEFTVLNKTSMIGKPTIHVFQ